jgi:hypothetical protein
MQDDEKRLDLRVFNPTRLVQRILSITTADWKFTVLMGCVLLVSNAVWNNTLISWGIVIVYGLLMVKYIPDDRAYYVPVQMVRSLRIRRNEGVRWPTKKRRFSVGRRLDSEVIPLEVNYVRGLGHIGIIHNFRNNTDSVVITGDGSDMSALSLTEQRDRLRMHAEGTIAVAGRPDVQVGISYVFRRGPFNAWQFRDDLAATGAPEIMDPHYLRADYLEDLSPAQRRRMNLHSNMVESQKLLNEFGSDVVMAAIVTIRRYGILAKISKRGAKKPKRTHRKSRDESQSVVENLETLPIADVANACVDGLKATGVDGVHVLNPRECEQYIRSGWDVTNQPDYNTQVHEGTVKAYSHWPMRRIQVLRRVSIYDNTAHAVLRVKALPAPMLPHFMRLLHGMGIDYPAFSLVGETVSSTGDYLALGRIRHLSDALAETVGFTKGIRSKEALESIEQREEQVANEQFVYLYNILIDVRLPVDGDNPDEDLRELERMVGILRNELRSRFGVVTNRIKLGSRQEAAMWSATVGTNML